MDAEPTGTEALEEQVRVTTYDETPDCILPRMVFMIQRLTVLPKNTLSKNYILPRAFVTWEPQGFSCYKAKPPYIHRGQGKKYFIFNNLR